MSELSGTNTNRMMNSSSFLQPTDAFAASYDQSGFYRMINEPMTFEYWTVEQFIGEQTGLARQVYLPNGRFVSRRGCKVNLLVNESENPRKFQEIMAEF